MRLIKHMWFLFLENFLDIFQLNCNYTLFEMQILNLYDFH